MKNSVMNRHLPEFCGSLTMDSHGAVIDADRYVTDALHCEKTAMIGRNIVEFLPDYSLETFYTLNEHYNISLLESRKLIAFTSIYAQDGKVYLEMILTQMEFLYNFFCKIGERAFSSEIIGLLSHDMAKIGEKSEILSRLEAEDGIVIRSGKMKSLFSLMEKVAPVNAILLFTGETGTGKSMYARLIHRISDRKDRPFIEINCAAIQESLIESELFGYVRGSFTGASGEGKVGMIEEADGGTLFLDEITELSPGVQQKLLQVLHEKKISRIGSNVQKKVDFRLITATNRDIEEMVRKGQFRKDLFYRINVIPVAIPPLRERGDDILALILRFMQGINEKYGMIKSFSDEAIQALCRYPWPGNVRELENFVERMALTSDDAVIQKEEFPLALQEYDIRVGNRVGTLKQMLAQYEKKIILEYYSKYKTSVKVGEKLSISQTSAAQKIRKYINE